jgi:hypothetical protein
MSSWSVVTGECAPDDTPDPPYPVFPSQEECEASLQEFFTCAELKCERAEPEAAQFSSLESCASSCYSYNSVKGTCVAVPPNAGAFKTAEECVRATNPALKHTTSDEQCHQHFVGPCTADEGYDPQTCVSYGTQCYSTTAAQCRTSDDCSTTWDLSCKNRREGGGSLYCQRSMGVCTCFHQEASALVWPSIVDAVAVKLAFPEQCAYPSLGPQNPLKLGIAFSGGGARAYSASIGVARALRRMPLGADSNDSNDANDSNDSNDSNDNVLDGAEYVSTNSGGGWFYGTYTFARGSGGFSADVLLGQSRAPQDMTLQNLKTDNDYVEYMGQRMTHFPVLSQALSNLFARGLSINDAWSNLMGTAFLKPYDIDYSVPVATDKAHAQRIYERNPELGMPITPLEGGPFFITTATLLETSLRAQGVYPIIYMTPMYSGVASVGLDAAVGGRWIETFAEGCAAPDPGVVTVPKRAASDCAGGGMLLDVQIPYNEIVTLRDIISASSSAHGMTTSTMSSFLLSHYAAWSPEHPGVNTQTLYTDGAVVDNCAIIGLLARGVTQVISFLSSWGELNDTCFFEEITMLFGVKSEACAPELMAGNSAQVFYDSDWPGVRDQLFQSKRGGGPTLARAQLRVKQNALMGVEGGYVVDILFLSLQRAPRFVEQLPPEVYAQLGPAGDFRNFPYIPTTQANASSISEYTLAQVNILASFTDWIVSQPEVQAHIQELTGATFNYADDGKGSCVLDDAGPYESKQECLDAIRYTFDWVDGVGCMRREVTTSSVQERKISLAQCLDRHRPRVLNQFPDFECSDYQDVFRPYIDRTVDPGNVLYLRCLADDEVKEHDQPANANYAPPSARGKMRTWCDSDTNCPSGSWCCADVFNKTKPAHSGRCVYCNDSNSFCWATGSESASNTCATNSMKVW